MFTPHDILRQYWGFDSFRPLQEEIIAHVLNSKDALALMPTGGGKSLCFQVPALAKEGVCIVVSPLIALMNDQVSGLKQKGIKAMALHSGLSYREIDQGLDRCVYGDIKLLYVSPERLRTELFRVRFQKMKVNLIAVDEAHCISQWGYDFRPAYLEIAALRALKPKAPILALTATATPDVVEDIQEQLLFKKKRVFRKSFLRPNLAYVVIHEENKRNRLLNICRNLAASGVVYVRNRKKTVQITDFLTRQGITAAAYHAGLDARLRTARQNEWSRGETQVIVATNAFGMGIDKPDVRFVVHLDIPEDIESYFQEAGRGGRDGKKAYAIILKEGHDLAVLRERVQRKYPNVDTVRKAYRALLNHLQLAAGAGQDAAFEIDLPKISKSSGIPPIDLYNSLKVLEGEGYIALSEAFFRPTRMRFLVQSDVLYGYQLRNPQIDQFIQVLLRSYSGMFDNLVKIDIPQIARRAQMKPEVVKGKLELLAQHEVIEYLPSSDATLVTFTQPALYDRSLRVSKEGYQNRKSLALNKLQAMIAYLENDVCRQRRLLNYFGETLKKDCGICDVCLNQKTQQKSEALRQRILSILQTSEMGPQELYSRLSRFDKTTVLKQLTLMVDEKILYYTPEKRLAISAKKMSKEKDI